MPSWGEILEELTRTAEGTTGAPDFDGVRRSYLRRLERLTGRETILYATAWLTSPSSDSTAITLVDMQGMMEVCRGLKGPDLDLILHSPGGIPEATASIVRYLRSKFERIRVFVPLAAMSAATMWSLACDEVVMGKHSQLGPIDPQLVTDRGQMPARAVIEQFERAKRECADPSQLPAWIPILQQYGPALLEQCEKAELLARGLAEEWLRDYMFKGRSDASTLAISAASYFADYEIHASHSMGIDRESARQQGLNIVDLEEDEELQDAVLSVHHATMLTFGMTSVVKLVENHLGRAFVQIESR